MVPKERHPESRHDGAFSGPVFAIGFRWRKWAERRSSGEGPCVLAGGVTGLPRNSSVSGYQSAAKSFQVGFIDSMSLFFFSLRHPLISFSRAMASTTRSNLSK